MCNKAGLLRRLERVEGLVVESVDHGIRLAKELFGDSRLRHLGSESKAIGVFEDLFVDDQLGEKVLVKAKIDTGAYRSSIDVGLAKKLGLLRKDNILMTKHYGSALGHHERQVIGITMYLQGQKIVTSASVADRTGLKRPMIVGRRDLQGFVVAFGPE